MQSQTGADPAWLTTLGHLDQLAEIELLENIQKQGTTTMTKTERESLLQVCRLRAKVAKSDAAAVAARRKSEFESSLAAEYDYDTDETWKQAHQIAEAA